MAESETRFITDKNGNRTHAVIPYSVYEQLIALKGLLSPVSKLGDHEIYTLSVKNAVAKGYPEGIRQKPEFVILKGSQAVLEPVESVPEHVQNLREDLLSEGTLELDIQNNCFVFIKDLKLPSASTAAAIVAGNVRNGLDVWVNREGFSLKESGFGVKNKKRLHSK